MRLIARRTLNGFVRQRVENSLQPIAQEHFDDWYRRVSKARWRTSAQLKSDFGSASIVSSQRVVFNIRGNHYRLVASLDYERMGVKVVWIGTHSEYDKINVKEVEYDARRYFDLSDSH